MVVPLKLTLRNLEFYEQNSDCSVNLYNYQCKYLFITTSIINMIHFSGCIQAVRLSYGTVVWDIAGEVAGKEIKPYGVCNDSDGNIYVADSNNERILMLDSKTGELLQVLMQEEKTGDIFDVCWTESQPQLTVRHGDPKSIKQISCYNKVIIS